MTIEYFHYLSRSFKLTCLQSFLLPTLGTLRTVFCSFLILLFGPFLTVGLGVRGQHGTVRCWELNVSLLQAVYPQSFELCGLSSHTFYLFQNIVYLSLYSMWSFPPWFISFSKILKIFVVVLGHTWLLYSGLTGLVLRVYSWWGSVNYIWSEHTSWCNSKSPLFSPSPQEKRNIQVDKPIRLEWMLCWFDPHELLRVAKNK